MAHKTDDDGVEIFDLTTFLWHTRCFAILIRPFLTFIQVLQLILRWQYPKVTFSVWLIISLLSSIIPSGYTVITFLAVLSLVCCLGLLHHHTQIFMKLFPDQELEASALQNYLQRSWGEEQKILDEYRRVLLRLDKIIESFNSHLEAIYSLLKWDRPLLSFSYTMVIAFTVVLLSITDLKVVIFIVNNAVLLGSGIYLRQKKRKLIKGQGTSSHTHSPTSKSHHAAVADKMALDDVHDSSDEQVIENKSEKEVDPEDCEIVEEDELLLEANDIKVSNENAVEGGNTNVIQKLMELRKRHQSLSGVCSHCHASLTTLLKRKYLCCNCGNQFCWKCCNQKVPRSFLGVTAPATKNDTILLCVSCHQQLHDKNS